MLALDPPPVPEGVTLAASAPGVAMVHLAWGEPERAFALSHWRAQLDLRPALTELWRSLSCGSLEGTSLETALRGNGGYARRGRVCGRMLRVLCELGLAEYVPPGRDRDARCVRLEGARTDLTRSAASRAYAARLEAAERYLRAGSPTAHAHAAAGAG